MARRDYAPRRHDATGRSTGRIHKRYALRSGPGPLGCAQFNWLPSGLIESEVWRGLSHNARKMIDRILVELAHHGGGENGDLIITHPQFVEAGLSNVDARKAVDDLLAAKLIRFKQGGLLDGSQEANRFGLAWMDAFNMDGEVIRADATRFFSAKAIDEKLGRPPPERSSSDHQDGPKP